MDDFDVVADSEGEELEFGVPKATNSLDAPLTTTAAKPYGQDVSIYDTNFPNSFSIADRAKTRQRNVRLSTPGPSTRVHDDDGLFDADHIRPFINGDDGDDYAAPRSKPRPRPKPRPKQKKPVETWDDPDPPPGTTTRVSYDPRAISPPIPGLATLSPPPQTRPKPRPIKRGQKAENNHQEQQQQQQQQQQPTSQLSIPLPTSPLPPSDPPAPTPTTREDAAISINEHVGSMPPIVTLAHPASSPSSLFSAADKHIAHIPDLDLEDDPLLLGPPSTFFTGSSSPGQPPPPPAKPIEIIDLCTLPPRSTTSKNGKEKEKPDAQASDKGKGKAKGKRKARDEDEFGLDMEDDDDAYDDGGKKKKAKAKGKTKTKTKVVRENGKKKTEEARSKKKILEVIVDTPPPKGNSPRAAFGLEDDVPCVARSSMPRNFEKGFVTPPRPATAGRHSREPGTPLSPVPDSEGEDMLEAGVTGLVKTTTVLASSGIKKRRKGVIYDDEDEIQESEEEGSSPKKKARIKNGTLINEKERDSAKAEPRKKQTKKERGKGKRVFDSESEGEFCENVSHNTSRILSDEEAEDESVKENVQDASSSSSKPKPPPPKYSPTTGDTNGATVKLVSTSLTSGYTIAPKTKSIPMGELIKRVNSLSHSHYSPSPIGKHKDKSMTPHLGMKVASVTAYSPYLKTSRSLLSKIAPLHPNRRTPPPPPPPPPPRKKSKKEIEREEQWEEELIESVGGPAAWSCLSETERKDMRRGKWAVERGEVDD